MDRLRRILLPLSLVLAGSGSHLGAALGGEPEKRALFAGAAVADQELADVRGRNADQMGLANMDAAMADNTIGDNAQTGVITIHSAAFSQNSGVFSTVINTGNSVVIQNSTNVNINLY